MASAGEALVGAFSLSILGTIAISIASGFAAGMIPSPPPGFAAESHGDHASGHESWKHEMGERAFTFVFAIFFVHSLWSGLRRDRAGLEGRLARILSKLRDNWFELIIGNAISAWATVLLLNIGQGFSPVRMLLQPVWELIRSIAVEAARFVLGASNTASVNDWFSWYNANSAKLSFWIIYMGGALDDLGVPNYKTLARWSWRKWRHRQQSTLPAPNSQPK
jgi:hypothetical protein